MDTLVIGCILPTTRVDWGLSPVRNVRRKAHNRNRDADENSTLKKVIPTAGI
jgi:hypothetical protein